MCIFLSVLSRRREDIKGKKSRIHSFRFSGDNDNEGTPVPIPNTEVKLINAENTCELPCWEDK